ncbi:MAG: DciA family protein [Caulobacter sp.]|nr:DciA family protein [Caulobacter sp.]
MPPRRPLPTVQEAAEILSRRRSKPPRRSAPPAGRSLAPVLKVLEERFGQGPGQLQLKWGEIVGETLARHTEPVKLVKARGNAPGTLELRVAGPAAAIVQHQAPDILKKVSLILGEGTITRLRIVQGAVRAHAARPQAIRRRPKGPLDAAAEQALAEGLADQPEGPLREALIRLGRETLRGRSG